jgi:hypothetical protein
MRKACIALRRCGYRQSEIRRCELQSDEANNRRCEAHSAEASNRHCEAHSAEAISFKLVSLQRMLAVDLPTVHMR